MKKQFIQPAIYVASFANVNVITSSMPFDPEEEVVEQWAGERLAQDEFRLTL